MPREVVTLHIGQAGCQVGQAVWELFCREHQVEPSGLRAEKLKYFDEDDTTYLSFFSETAHGQHVPRAVFVDTDPTTRDEIFKSDYSRLFHPEYVLGYKQDCKNNFFEGRSMASGFKVKEDVLDRVRMAVDLCSNLEGFFVFHAIGGGTGSGLGVEVLHALREQFDKKVIFEPMIVPSTKFSNSVVEPYNACFSIHYTRDVVDLSLMLDNEAAYRMCQKNLGITNPDFYHVNSLIAQCVSASTTSLRYEAELNANLTEIMMNLVPSKQFRYPILSLSPVRHPSKGKHEQFSTNEIITDLFEERNVLCDCGQNLRLNRYLAAVVLLRGLEGAPSKDGTLKDVTLKSEASGAGNKGMMPIEANSVLTSLQGLLNPRGSHRQPLRFVPWLDSGFKVGVVGVPPSVQEDIMAETDRLGAMIGNTTAVRQLFVRQYVKFLKLLYHKAYVWQFLDANGELDAFDEARQGIREIIDEYEKLLLSCVEGENERFGEAAFRLEGRTGTG